MKSIIEYIVESSDIVGKFISYLKENAKKIGELPTNHKSYYDYFNECNPFDNNKFSLNVSNMVYADDYCEEHGIDDVEEDDEGFVEYIAKPFNKDQIKEKLDIVFMNNKEPEKITDDSETKVEEVQTDTPKYDPNVDRFKDVPAYVVGSDDNK